MGIRGRGKSVTFHRDFTGISPGFHLNRFASEIGPSRAAPRFVVRLKDSVREHGLGDFFEPGDIGAVDVIDSAVFFAVVNTATMNFGHDFT